jgi:hypothetical protein
MRTGLEVLNNREILIREVGDDESVIDRETGYPTYGLLGGAASARGGRRNSRESEKCR